MLAKAGPRSVAELESGERDEPERQRGEDAHLQEHARPEPPRSADQRPASCAGRATNTMPAISPTSSVDRAPAAVPFWHREQVEPEQPDKHHRHRDVPAHQHGHGAPEDAPARSTGRPEVPGTRRRPRRSSTIPPCRATSCCAATPTMTPVKASSAPARPCSVLSVETRRDSTARIGRSRLAVPDQDHRRSSMSSRCAPPSCSSTSLSGPKYHEGSSPARRRSPAGPRCARRPPAVQRRCASRQSNQRAVIELSSTMRKPTASAVRAVTSKMVVPARAVRGAVIGEHPARARVEPDALDALRRSAFRASAAAPNAAAPAPVHPGPAPPPAPRQAPPPARSRRSATG